MREKNHVKSSNNSLRGIGKLGWTEFGKMASTVRRLESTFEEKTTYGNKKKKKEKVRCSKCGRTFIGSIPPQHSKVSYLPDGFSRCSYPEPIFLYGLCQIKYNDIVYNLDDTVYFMKHNQILERKIEQINVYNIDGARLKFYDDSEEYLLTSFKNNLIKL